MIVWLEHYRNHIYNCLARDSDIISQQEIEIVNDLEFSDTL